MCKPEWESACHHMSTCALTGSAAFFDSIPGSFILINGPLWCYFYTMKYVEDYDASALRRFHCTQPESDALVYGTENDLLAGFDFIKSNYTPERVFVQNNCSVSLVGDDLEGIAAKAGLPWPVYAIDSGGLAGDFPEGYQKAFLRVIEEIKPQQKKSNTDTASPKPSINVLGLTPMYYRGEEDIAEIRRLLEASGYKVNAIPGGGASWEDIQRLPEADLNLVVRDELALKAAVALKKAFGTPYLSAGLPYGIEGTLLWLRKIAAALPGADLAAIEQEAEKIKQRLQFRGGNTQSLWGPLWFDTVLVSGPPSEAAGIAEAIRSEWVDTGRLIVCFTHAADLHPNAADEIYIVERNDAAIKTMYENWDNGLVLGSSMEAGKLLRLQKPFVNCNIAFPTYHEMSVTDLPLCGLRGATLLFEKIWNAKLQDAMAHVKD